MMSTFPTYGGKLPEYLNPFNPRHYLLLVYWVYFRPTALKYYLYRADPNLYCDGLDLNSILRLRAYRNVYLMIPGAVILLSVLAGLLFVLVMIYGLQETTKINWLGMAGAVAGPAIGFGYSLLGSLAIGVAGGVAVGITFGVAGGVTSLALLVSGIQLSVQVCAAIALIAGLAFRIGFGAVSGVAVGAIFGVVFGVAIGAWFYTTDAVAIAIAFVIASSAGALGAIFYPFELFVALYSAFRSSPNGGLTHPVEWNELLVLPLPGTRWALLRRLQRDAESGLAIVAEVARNPFQRWAAQQALHKYLHEHSAPLYFLYELLRSPKLDEYVFAPVSRGDWEVLPIMRQLLLAELDRKSLDGSADPTNRFAESLVWDLTRRWHDRRQTPLTRFAGMLDRLLEEGTVDAKDFDLSEYQTTYEGLTDYSGSVEISQSFAALATFLTYDNLDNIRAAVDVVETLPEIPLDTAVRPTVLTALERLKEVGAEVASYQDATSQRNKLAALVRAGDALDRLEQCVTAEVVAPEQTILQRIIRQWRRLVSDEQSELARITVLRRVANPYVAGNPVTDAQFVGRDDILQQLEEIWEKEKQCDSVVLFGHRRMGKTSILQNLGAYFSDRTVIVDFNMQRIGRVENTGQLLFYLAQKMYDAWVERTQTDIGEPNQDEFINDPYIAFDRFLQRLDRVVDGDRFIVTVDEFELIEKQINERRIEPELLANWRGTFQTYPWFIMAFAGLHNLEEMRRDYWNPLYSGVRAIRVSFLSREAAQQLITQPTPDFPLDYDSDAVEEIILLTNGQPYLVQLICDNLVTRFNRQTFNQGIKRDSRFTVEDVEAVINSPEFYQDGGAYFEGVWSQAEYSQPAGQLQILKALTDTNLSLTELAEQTGLSPEQAEKALETLERHDVIEQQGDRYLYTVELMRRWVRERKM